jgi:hypothetical protein
MPLPPPGRPYVTSVKFAGGQLTFSVRVDDFQSDEEEYVEISGYATQTGGAFANIYNVATIPPKANGTNDPPPVDVTATPGPDKKFSKDQDITVAIRVSKVWVTVLGIGVASENQLQTADDGTTWDTVRQVSEMYDTSSSAGAS